MGKQAIDNSCIIVRMYDYLFICGISAGPDEPMELSV